MCISGAAVAITYIFGVLAWFGGLLLGLATAEAMPMLIAAGGAVSIGSIVFLNLFRKG